MDFFERVHDHVAPSRRNAYRPHLLRDRWLVSLLALSLVAEAILLSGVLPALVVPTPAAVVQTDIIALTNTERVRASLGILEESALLDAAAQAKADDMAAKGYFSHTGPEGEKPWVWFERGGYTYRYAGENLAVRFSESNEVMVAWMASPTHRANIVKGAYTEIGVGVAQGMYKGSPATFVVQFFGSPEVAAASKLAAPVAQKPAAAPAAQPSVPTQVEVAGAEDTAPAATELVRTGNSGVQSAARQFLRALSEPEVANGLLWGIGAMLLLALGLTFFMHLQIQPTTMLASGTVVAAVVFLFIAVNTRFVLPQEGALSAAAALAQGGEVGVAASVVQSEL